MSLFGTYGISIKYFLGLYIGTFTVCKNMGRVARNMGNNFVFKTDFVFKYFLNDRVLSHYNNP